MADERTRPPHNQPARIPADYDWRSLHDRDGGDLEEHYFATLKALGAQPGMLGTIFRKAQNKIRIPPSCAA